MLMLDLICQRLISELEESSGMCHLSINLGQCSLDNYSFIFIQLRLESAWFGQ